MVRFCIAVYTRNIGILSQNFDEGYAVVLPNSLCIYFEEILRKSSLAFYLFCCDQNFLLNLIFCISNGILTVINNFSIFQNCHQTERLIAFGENEKDMRTGLLTKLNLQNTDKPALLKLHKSTIYVSIKF